MRRTAALLGLVSSTGLSRHLVGFPPWSARASRSRSPRPSASPRPSPCRGMTRVRLAAAMIDPVECGCQARVEYPPAVRVQPDHRAEDRLDRVMTAAAPAGSRRTSSRAAGAAPSWLASSCLRRREDALPQPPYFVLSPLPVNRQPGKGIAFRSVHHQVSNLPFSSGHLPYPAGYRRTAARSCLLAVGIRFLAILFPPGDRPSSRSAHRPCQTGSRRGSRVPHT